MLECYVHLTHRNLPKHNVGTILFSVSKNRWDAKYRSYAILVYYFFIYKLYLGVFPKRLTVGGGGYSCHCLH